MLHVLDDNGGPPHLRDNGMTIPELDRLVGKTALDPTTKQCLRVVRRAVLSGRATDPVLGQYSWSVEVDVPNGTSRRFRFSMRRNDQ